MNKLNSETSCSNNFQVPLIYPVMIWICKQTQIISTSFPSNSREVPRTFFPSNSRREVPLTFFPSHSLRQVLLTFFPSHSRRQVPRTSFPSNSRREVPRTFFSSHSRRQVPHTSFPSNSRCEVPRTCFPIHSRRQAPHTSFPSNSRREVPRTSFPSHSRRQVPRTFFPSHSRRQVPRTSFPSHFRRQVPRTYELTPYPFSCRAPRALARTVFKVWSARNKSECILPCLANCQQFGLFNFCLPESFRFFSFYFPHHLWTTRHVTGTVDPSCTCVLMSCVLPWCDLRSGLGVFFLYQHLIRHGSRSGELKTQKIKVPCGENTQLDRSPFEA